MQVDATNIRIDTAELRAPKRLDDGSWRYEAVISTTTALLSYDWGQERADEAALSDPAYLDALRGLPVVAKHPRSARVDVEQPGTYTEVGRITGARYDSTRSAAVIELVVSSPAANRRIKAGENGVSEGYTVTQLDTSTKPARQLGRRPNHVALTLELDPRAAGARIRHDHTKDISMELSDFLALCTAFSLRCDSLDHLRADLDALGSHKATADAEKTRADSAEGALARVAPVLSALGVDPSRTDAVDAPAVLAAAVGEVVELRLRADSLGVKLEGVPADAGAIRKAMALHLGGDPARCDSRDYCDGLIAAPAKSSIDAATSTRVDSTAPTTIV